MRDYAFHHVDVFTETPFEGNPLAVFPDARGLTAATMQRTARELNLSETVFAFPPKSRDAAAALRIFTPGAELPFAGHPTIGAAFVLQRMGTITQERDAVVFEEGVGPVPVRIESLQPFLAWLTTPPVTFGPTMTDRSAVSAMLGLESEALCDGVPVQVVTAGNPFVFVALRDRVNVDRASLDARAFRETVGSVDTNGVYIFALQDGGVYSRLFAPEQGIIEDPATGSATGPLAAYLLEYGMMHCDGLLEFIAEQGTYMGRRSVLRVRVSGNPRDRKIEVGGSAVALIEGRLQLNDNAGG